MDTQTLVGQSIFVAVVAGTAIVNHYKGRTARRGQSDSLNGHFAELRRAIDGRFDTVEHRLDQVEDGVKEVRAFCVGPDSQNGFRKEIGEIKDSVVGLEKRERERLEQKAYDRRTGT